MVALKTLVYKTSIDPKHLELKNCIRNNQKEEAREKNLQSLSIKWPNY